MSDENLIDQQKLIYHPERVSDWLEGQDVFPIYIEIGAVGKCNHRCIFCAFDYLKYEGSILETSILKTFLSNCALKGIKSVVFAGEGEPFVHKDLPELINFAKNCGLDVGVSTNGVLFKREKIKKCLKSLSWIRFSIDAVTKETYSKIHRCPSSDFQDVIKNIQDTVIIKKEEKNNCVIGIQTVAISENINELLKLGELAKNLGVDYFTIKPFTSHPYSNTNLKCDFKDLLCLESKLKVLETDDFKIIFRNKAFTKVGKKRLFKSCFGHNFISYLDANGDLYVCSAFLGNQKFVFGNIYEKSFDDIWRGVRRKEVLKNISKMNCDECRMGCRLDEINQYLWKLKHRVEIPHVNFI